MKYLGLIYGLFFLVACGVTPEEPVDDNDTGDTAVTESNPVEFENNMSEFGGCGDLFIYAKNSDDTNSIKISGAGFVRYTFDAEESVSFSYNLSEDIHLDSGDTIPIVIEVQLGENLNSVSCNDAIDPELEPVVEKTYLPVAGTIQLIVEPTGEETSWGEMPAEATVFVRDAHFCVRETGDCIQIEDLRMTANVGWLPG